MKDSIAVSVQNVSKKFRLFGSPKDHLREALHPFKRKYHHEFWALKDITFDVPKGMTLGIIGRNGSGKSTLLQMICSVLRPTSGTVAVNGRISALLELGAGFNPEFTGRDNVLLNGALMGFSGKEMEERLPLIEKFADIGEFIDQPVKTYSSGMFVRLAFAAAINVDPDILIVDEALAVGDAKFQHKCYQKFIEFQEAGKTIVFVTHSTDAVIRHCDRAILLENGQIIEIGEPKLITNYYIDLLFTGKISNYELSPVLVEDNVKGFNIVHYKTSYYALSLSLGHIDLTRLMNNDLEKYIDRGQCIIGSSLDEVHQLMGQSASGIDESVNQNLISFTPEIENAKAEMALMKFLKETPSEDNCVHRKSYNKNEYRQASNLSEIIDYLLVENDNTCDPISVVSGNKLSIYIKAKFHERIEQPLFGFAIKTIDGILIYALNSYFSSVRVEPAKESDVIVFGFSLELNLAPGDYFIDLGIDKQRQASDNKTGRICNYDSLDRRCSIAHLQVQENNWFHGIADFKANLKEFARTGKIVRNE